MSTMGLFVTWSLVCVNFSASREFQFLNRKVYNIIFYEDFSPSFTEAASTRQRDLHRELSDLRIALENVTVLTPNSNMSQVQWKVQTSDTSHGGSCITMKTVFT